MNKRLRRDERGQAILVTVLFLTVLIGAVAITLDVASWYRQQRQAQATADAAALSGAQDLPFSTTAATTSAQSYADKNGGGVAGADITIQSDWSPNDTIQVTAHRTSNGFFSRLFGIDTVNVHATAAAREAVPDQVFGAAPIVVSRFHPDLGGPGCPCFNVETTLPLGKDGAPGAFGIMNLDPNVNNGLPPIADWILNGYDGYLAAPANYDSDPGAKFDGNDIRDALTARLGHELLFPVFDNLGGGGSVAQYHVVGWVAFHLDAFDLHVHGNQQVITGYFTRVIWDGLQSKKGNHQPQPDFGVYSVSLVK